MKFLINWFEIPARNIDRAVQFYNQVFDLELKVTDCGGEKMACFPEMNGMSGSISQVAGFTPSPDGVQITFDGGDDLNNTLARVKKAGGTVVREKTVIEALGRGSFALFTDSEGNTIGVYSDT
ncbi:MAG: VOC family protein [Chitinivibrionales bacterium]|nr:VOC family protein [Chitinivibrionales bacterium]